MASSTARVRSISADHAPLTHGEAALIRSYLGTSLVGVVPGSALEQRLRELASLDDRGATLEVVRGLLQRLAAVDEAIDRIVAAIQVGDLAGSAELAVLRARGKTLADRLADALNYPLERNVFSPKGTT